MNKALLLSGRHEGKEIYQLVLPGKWITYTYNESEETREEFLKGTSEEVVGIIKSAYGLESFTIGSKRGVLIINNARQEVEKIDPSALESRLKEKLVDEIILPLSGDIC